jgi:hypothetical protein
MGRALDMLLFCSITGQVVNYTCRWVGRLHRYEQCLLRTTQLF